MIYLLQASFLALIGAVLGLCWDMECAKEQLPPTGFKIYRKRCSMYTLNGGMILYALVAAAIVILFLTIPALRRTKYTIVNESMAKTVL